MSFLDPKGWSMSFLADAEIDSVHSVSAKRDSRRCLIYPERSQGSTILSEPFDSLSGWTKDNSGTGDSYIVHWPDPDDAIGNVLDLHGGSGSSATAKVKRSLGTVPNSFSFLAITRLDQVGTNGADALHICVQNNAGKMLLVRFTDGKAEAYVSGAWRQVAAWGGDWWTEWWAEAVDNGDGTHTVSLYAGSALYGSYTGTLLTGSSADNNSIYIAQPNAVNNYRRSQVSVINVGFTQLADEMTMCTPKVPAEQSPATAEFRMLIEDVSTDLAEVGFEVWVSKAEDGSGQPIWSQLAVDSCEVWGKGIMDWWKDMYEAHASGSFASGSGTDVRVYVKTPAGSMLPIKFVSIRWEY